MRASSLPVGHSRKYRCRDEGKPIDSTRRRGGAGRVRSGFLSGAGVERFGPRVLAGGHDGGVEAGRPRLMDNMPQDRPAVGDVPPAALDRANDDLGDLMLPREVDDGPGGVIILYLVPAGTQVGRQLPQAVGRLAVRGQAAVAGGDVDYVEFPA